MEFTKRKIGSGLRIISAPMENTDTVTLLVLVGTGANYEERKTSGLSHFLEHMFFKGTKKYPKPGQLDRMLDAVGAMHNAFTSREETGYWIKVDSKHFPLALKFVSEILQNALLKDEEINRERGVILEEMNMYWDDPRRNIWSSFEALLYGDNPYGWDVLGRAHNIRKMPRSAFVRYWRSQYVASNTVVVVAGNISENIALRKIEESFSVLRQGKFKEAPGFKKIVPGPRIRVEEKNTAQTHLIVGSVGLALSHRDRLTAEILATILGGYMSSRLFMEIREKYGLAYAVKAYHQAHRNTGYFAAYAGVPHERAQEVVDRVVSNLHRIKRSGVTSEELDRAKENTKGRLQISLESTDEVAAFVGEQEVLLGKIETPEKIMKKLGKISKEAVRRVARNIFNGNNIYLALIGPHSSADPYEKILKSL